MAATPFITLEEAKSFLDGGSNSYSGNDTMLELLLNGVCEAVEEYIRRPVVARSITDTRSGTGAAHIFLRPTIFSVASVSEDGTALESTGYTFDPEAGYIIRLCAAYTAGTWCKGTRNITITYTAGVAEDVASVPPNIKVAALMAFKFYALSGPVDGGQVIETGSMIKPDSFPRASRFLLDRYVVVNAG